MLGVLNLSKNIDMFGNLGMHVEVMIVRTNYVYYHTNNSTLGWFGLKVLVGVHAL